MASLDLTISEIERKFCGVLTKEAASCELHGPFVSVTSRNSERASRCPVCADEAQRLRDDSDAVEQAAKAKARRLELRLGASMIPARFAGKSFTDYRCTSKQQEINLSTCRGYAQHFTSHAAAGRCLSLLGNPGTGKTHLAAAIARHLINRLGVTAVYRTVGSLLQYVKGSYDRGADYTEAAAFASLVEPGLLIIDEVGATKPTEFEQATLFAVINGRYEELRPTVVISNLMPADLREVLGERSFDRLSEADGIVLVFDWESARRASA
jgi:DNA replication protein DnaC